jgi:flavodoxin
MKALVVYDSFFGNTEKIARAIAEGMTSNAEVEVKKISEVTQPDFVNADWVVVGSPTRGFRPTKTISSFMQVLPDGLLRGKKVAAFDTRIGEREINAGPFFLKYLVRIFGYAAKPLASSLLKAGGLQPLQPEGFLVHGTEGPLADGELERANAWGKMLIASEVNVIEKENSRPLFPGLG